MNNQLDRWQKVSDGVYVPRLDHNSAVITVGLEDIVELKKQAQLSTKKRARICIHNDNSSRLHQMLLVVQKESYVRPHRHQNKVESFHLIEGEMDVVIFSDEGQVLEIIPMRTFAHSKGSLLYRLNNSLFHTLIIHSPFVVFHEITQGPFAVNESEYASWAPKEEQSDLASVWIENLKKGYQHA